MRGETVRPNLNGMALRRGRTLEMIAPVVMENPYQKPSRFRSLAPDLAGMHRCQPTDHPVFPESFPSFRSGDSQSNSRPHTIMPTQRHLFSAAALGILCVLALLWHASLLEKWTPSPETLTEKTARTIAIALPVIDHGAVPLPLANPGGGSPAQMDQDALRNSQAQTRAVLDRMPPSEQESFQQALHQARYGIEPVTAELRKERQNLTGVSHHASNPAQDLMFGFLDDGGLLLKSGKVGKNWQGTLRLKGAG